MRELLHRLIRRGPRFLLLAGFALGCLLPARAPGQTTITNASLSSLRSALASGATNIVLAFDGTIVVTSPLTISFNTTLDASGHVVGFAGAGSNRVFDVPAGKSFNLIHATITAGKSVGANGANGANGVGQTPSCNGHSGGSGAAGTDGLGGAVRNLGNATFVNCTFATNSAVGGNGGNGGNGANGDFAGGAGGAGANAGRGFGGAIYNGGTLVLTNCTFANNTAAGGNGGAAGASGSPSPFQSSGGPGGGAAGAGLYNTGIATLVNCVVYNNIGAGGNSAAAGNSPGNYGGTGLNGQPGADGTGGGICNVATNTLVNCTIFGNEVIGGNGGNGGNGDFSGGAGGNGGNGIGAGYYNSGTASLTNCTLSSSETIGGTNGIDQAKSGSTSVPGSSLGDNLANAGGTLALKNCILDNPLVSANAYGAITDQGNNLSSDGTPSFTQSSSKANTDPMLDVLTDNGGATLTMALLPGSPAIDAGGDLPYPKFDQRGVFRPVQAHFDIGAYEYGVAPSILSGRVSLGAAPLAGVTVFATNTTGAIISTTSDVNGNYSFGFLPGNTVTIAPQPAGYFSPPSLPGVTTANNVPNLNFNATNAGPQTLTRSTNSLLQISLPGIPNQSYRIQASTNLLNWQDIATNNSGSSGQIQFSNRSTNFTTRFFRAVTP